MLSEPAAGRSQMKITLEYGGAKMTYEEDFNGFTAGQLKEIFSRMLVQATFPPSVIDLSGGDKYVCTLKESEDGILQG